MRNRERERRAQRKRCEQEIRLQMFVLAVGATLLLFLVIVGIGRWRMRIYMMERFLERLAKSAYAENFIIKGGILITSLVGVSMRSTMDIDTSISGFTLSQEETLRVVTEISEIDMDDGVTFSVKSVSGIMDEMDYPGIRLALDEWLQNRHPMSLSQTSKLFFGRFLLLHTLDYSRYEDDIRNMAVRNGIDPFHEKTGHDLFCQKSEQGERPRRTDTAV